MKQIGHRGGAGELPENTSSAFKNAMFLGLSMIEFDVHCTKDEALVIHHDYSTLRQTGVNMLISESTLEELKALNMASYKSDYPFEEKILTLDEVFEMLPDEMIINVEIKNITRYKTNIAELVVDAIVRNNRQNTVIVSAFDHEVLKRIAIVNPEIRIGLLLYSNILNPVNYVKSLDFDVYSVHAAIELVDETFIRDMQGEGYQVYVYTVNTQEEFDYMEEVGASGVFTDYPGRFAPMIVTGKPDAINIVL